MWNVCILFTAAEVLSLRQRMSLPGALRSGRSNTEFDKAMFDLFSAMKTTPIQIQR